MTNVHLKLDRLACSLLLSPVLKEYYCRISRKLAMKGFFDNKCVVKTGEGFWINVNKKDSVAWRVYFTGFHEKNIGRLINSRLWKGDVFIDVGANIGYFSIMGAKAVGPLGSVIAFEASPENTQVLNNNIRLNDLRNIDVRNVAISDHVGEIPIYSSGSGFLAQKSILVSRGGEIEARVPTMPLTASTLGVEVSRIGLIKIDVEGAEELVVSGMSALLDDPSFRADIILEISPGDLSVDVRHFLDPFVSRGYKIYQVPNDFRLRTYFGPTEEMSWSEMDVNSIETLGDVLLSRRAPSAESPAGN